MNIQAGGLTIRSPAASIYLLSNTGNILFGASSDVILTRDAANTLALRNGAAALQTLNIYGTYGNATNYERMYITATPATSAVAIGASAAGSGAANIDIQIIPHGSGYVSLGTYAASASILGAGYVTIKDSGGTLRKLVVAT